MWDVFPYVGGAMQSGVAESFRIRFGTQLSRTDHLAQVVNRQCVPQGNPFGTCNPRLLPHYSGASDHQCEIVSLNSTAELLHSSIDVGEERARAQMTLRLDGFDQLGFAKLIS